MIEAPHHEEHRGHTPKPAFALAKQIARSCARAPPCNHKRLGLISSIYWNLHSERLGALLIGVS